MHPNCSVTRSELHESHPPFIGSKPQQFTVKGNSLKAITLSQFSQNVFALMTGNILAQVVTVGATLITTRLFTPENFGILAMFIAVVNISDKLATLCYERAILLPQKDEEAINILFLSFLILLFFTSLIALLTWIESNVANKIANPELGFWIYIIPIAVLLTGSVKIIRFWLLREKKFKLVAFSRFGESTASAITKISIGFLVGSCAGGLIAGVIAGLVMSLLIVLINPVTTNIKNQIHSVSRNNLRLVAMTYRKFPLFSTWNAFLNVFSQQLIILMFSFYFSPAVVGFYSLGSRVLKQPMIFLSESIRNAYFQKAAHDLGQGQHIQASFKKLTAFLFLIGIAPFLILYFRGSSIFSFIFGAQWSTTGLYIECMAPWFFLLFMGTPTNVIYEVLYKQDIKLFLNITKFTLAFLSLFIGYQLYRDALSVLKIFVSVNVMLELLTISIAFIFVSKQQAT